ncbi:uncharacterized protein L3040_004000 [Drepanopeziza brunnea f. sp. 'multigermtubi']|uniref:Uncharacterized protein n=1 Tax=Marssonina brunnea f. sp. multigermtubi (strain MB_m1) TaxID=1072389 RepID=K1WBP9_MARBU|nr:uncharacterized protein MBM_06991 [Drepanopeziza brunnea f. sp. 'multigermtubi' MB_m1]EKD14780.1 hypothetical protein MBM_06991 [Drepanopeziza brunnea f. sp. 'multigermtubi' MB_m1]KAJ5046773.1 hypothetical protein L3040_004000 [Drepanopeziza brunnea f. sp. 'multigermtubi']
MDEHPTREPSTFPSGLFLSAWKLGSADTEVVCTEKEMLTRELALDPIKGLVLAAQVSAAGLTVLQADRGPPAAVDQYSFGISEDQEVGTVSILIDRAAADRMYFLTWFHGLDDKGPRKPDGWKPEDTQYLTIEFRREKSASADKVAATYSIVNEAIFDANCKCVVAHDRQGVKQQCYVGVLEGNDNCSRGENCQYQHKNSYGFFGAVLGRWQTPTIIRDALKLMFGQLQKSQRIPIKPSVEVLELAVVPGQSFGELCKYLTTHQVVDAEPSPAMASESRSAKKKRNRADSGSLQGREPLRNFSAFGGRSTVKSAAATQRR